jgi:hypothetical protein
MKEFKPTWLYVKQHSITGLKYFGKTIRDPLTYTGSGVYWIRHLKHHGNDVITTWCQLFTNKQSLVEFAESFSKENNIVESTQWANLRPEDGLMGGDTGITDSGRQKLSNKSKNFRHSAESKQKIKEARSKQTNLRTGKKHSAETIEKIKAKRALQIITEETKSKISKSLQGNKNNQFSKGVAK